ncbi:hypothetical protein RhiJN_10030 [Ceratobasidium sp. AG-Ba]|nr:hypothetical protein RhiJN_10030 [Ceratobasidium sp. AG-Ba]QRW10796.1 hypothetical protein RhiLY_09795 [Ceratobasidium sp. AG-Ba]
MLSFRLLTLFALVPLTNYKSTICPNVLDAALCDAHKYITSAVTALPVSWGAHTVAEDHIPVNAVPTTSMVKLRAQDAVFALSDSCNGVPDQPYGVSCGSSAMSTHPTPARSPTERARWYASPSRPMSCSLPPSPTKPLGRSSVRARLSSLLWMGPVSVVALRPHRISLWGWSAFRQRRSNSDEPVRVIRSGPPPNTCTLPDPSRCGVGAFYFELIEVLPEYRPTYSPLPELLFIGVSLAVLVLTGLVYTGVLSLTWWMIHCVLYALIAVVSSAVNTVSALFHILGRAAGWLTVIAAALWRYLCSLWGADIATLNTQYGERCYNDIVAGGITARPSGTFNWSTSPDVCDTRRRWFPVKVADDRPSQARSTGRTSTVGASAVATPSIATDSDDLCSFTDESSVGPASDSPSRSAYLRARTPRRMSTIKNQARNRARVKRPKPPGDEGYEADHELDAPSTRPGPLDQPLSEQEFTLFGCVLLAAMFAEDTGTA